MRCHNIIILVLCLGAVLSNSSTIKADDTSTFVQTPNGTSVLAWIMDEMSQNDINKANEWATSEYPNALFLSDASRRYNCHAYAWYISDGGEVVWIDDEQAFWQDNSYVSVSTETEATKVSFGATYHSAETSTTSGWFISKWGGYPLMYHEASDCPYNASTLSYYKRNADNPAASIHGFSIIDGIARWKADSEFMTAEYLVEGRSGFEDQWHSVSRVDPAGPGWHTVDVSGTDVVLFRLIEKEKCGRRIIHGVATQRGKEIKERSSRSSFNTMKEKLSKLEEVRREQKGERFRSAVEGQTCVIFTPDSLSDEAELYVADYWRNIWGYNVIVDTIDGYPNDPDEFRDSLKASIADYAANGAFYFHLIGDANDWREFDGELTPSLWVSTWEQIRQNYLASGYPVGGQPEKDIIPTYVLPDTLPRDRNTAYYTPYIFSDMPYADIDNDSIPDVVVTRWPANSAADVMRLAFKMQYYHNGYFPDNQIYKIGFLVGDIDHDGEGDGAYAREVADSIEDVLPPGQDIVHLYESDYQIDADRNYAAANLWNNELPELLILISSFSNRSWPGNFFDQTLESGAFHMSMIEYFLNHTPLVIAGSCDGGDFARTEDPDFGTPIAEKFLLEEDKGAVAWLGPTAGSWQNGNDAIVRYTIEEIFADPYRPMAESWLVAIQRVFNDYKNQQGVLRTAMAYTFLGNPLSRFCHVLNIVDADEQTVPRKTLSLDQNTPNPFNPNTRISLTTTQTGQVSLKVYDVAGKLIRTLLNNNLRAGNHVVNWNGCNNAGAAVASGVYFCRLVTDEGTRAKKMVILR